MAFSSKVDRFDGRLVFTPSGRVDAESVEDFTTAVVAAAREANGQGELVVDLSQLAFMVSRGLRALTLAQREGAPVKLAAPNDQMLDILRISRYDKLFEIVDKA
jgi:anti-sigma B factor antagonist